MNRSKKPNNVTKLHYLPKFNIGVLFLAVIFIYLVISFIMYMTKEKVLTYEVCAGQLVSDNTFSGVVIYDEHAEYAAKSGYINYFLKDNERAGANTVIGMLDETGSISARLAETARNHPDGGINAATLNNIEHRLTAYSKEYQALEFYQAYRVLDDISSILTEYNAGYMVESLMTLLEEENNFVSLIKPSQSTMVSFYMDSMFGLTENLVNKDTFNQENYSGTNLKNRELIGANDILYRRIDSDTWKVVFPLTENQVSQYASANNVTVKFLNQKIQAAAEFSILHNADGSYGMLTLNKYLVNFLNTRFVDFEISQSSVTGLKIPLSAVCEKEFFTIPVEYGCTSDDDERDTGFLLLGYDNAGNKTRRFVDATYYANDNGYYYVSKDIFKVGDCVVMPPKEGAISLDDTVYIVGTVAALKGTYCINRGYCQFRKVNILERNDEYYIVERGTTYGLSIYDHIILNAEFVTENQIIY